MAASKKKSWKDIHPKQRARIAVLGSVQLALQAYALKDLKKRPASLVRGPKPAWFAASFLNFLGPAAYLLFGRKKPVQV
jgi:hypothetical protein